MELSLDKRLFGGDFPKKHTDNRKGYGGCQPQLDQI